MFFFKANKSADAHDKTDRKSFKIVRYKLKKIVLEKVFFQSKVKFKMTPISSYLDILERVGSCGRC